MNFFPTYHSDPLRPQIQDIWDKMSSSLQNSSTVIISYAIPEEETITN